MDAFILVFTLGIMLAIGVPVAYAVGISAIIGAGILIFRWKP